MWTSRTHPMLGIFDILGSKGRSDLAVIDVDGGNTAEEQHDRLALIYGLNCNP